jgi:hypothetical protein
VAEVELEGAVSEVIRTIPFVWLSVDDEPGPASMRGKIERNAIALLSNFDRPPLDPPSPTWLGLHCNRDRVRASGLWNQNHVDESYDPARIPQRSWMLCQPSALSNGKSSGCSAR